MPEASAQGQLGRILHLLPLAARPGGAGYDELAGALGVSRDQVVRDLEEVTAREYYHPAGSANDISVALDPDRVTVWTGGQFQRPVRLSLPEAAALHLGLRILAAEREDPALLDVMRAVEEQLAWAVPDDIDDQVVVAADPAAGDRLRALMVQAARTSRTCRLSYLKPDAARPEPRTLDPYAVVYAEGNWYVIGRCHDHGETRIFRIDRIVEARMLDDTFQAPASFDLADYVSDGRVYRADQELEVPVRYGPAVARWLTERGEGEAREDGSVIVRHAVADPGWLVRHVLQYGPDAEVLGPDEVREMVRAGAEGVVCGETAA